MQLTLACLLQLGAQCHDLQPGNNWLVQHVGGPGRRRQLIFRTSPAFLCTRNHVFACGCRVARCKCKCATACEPARFQRHRPTSSEPPELRSGSRQLCRCGHARVWDPRTARLCQRQPPGKAIRAGDNILFGRSAQLIPVVSESCITERRGEPEGIFEHAGKEATVRRQFDRNGCRA